MFFAPYKDHQRHRGTALCSDITVTLLRSKIIFNAICSYSSFTFTYQSADAHNDVLLKSFFQCSLPVDE
ncbi:hypothetical protein POVCU2_0000660 [Plasmodium ovale curtisi]|uniref:Uncharacterized protein n=1 Tax=Plasmodium ovale curtisi TaxID=864141 RepID=A0A1A8VKW9_PLAOA|nr:hypothetical protein POVCU2_0000660 [Plasmodium ovale curtisi]